MKQIYSFVLFVVFTTQLSYATNICSRCLKQERIFTVNHQKRAFCTFVGGKVPGFVQFQAKTLAQCEHLKTVLTRFAIQTIEIQSATISTERVLLAVPSTSMPAANIIIANERDEFKSDEIYAKPETRLFKLPSTTSEVYGVIIPKKVSTTATTSTTTSTTTTTSSPFTSKSAIIASTTHVPPTSAKLIPTTSTTTTTGTSTTTTTSSLSTSKSAIIASTTHVPPTSAKLIPTTATTTSIKVPFIVPAPTKEASPTSSLVTTMMSTRQTTSTTGTLISFLEKVSDARIVSPGPVKIEATKCKTTKWDVLTTQTSAIIAEKEKKLWKAMYRTFVLIQALTVLNQTSSAMQNFNKMNPYSFFQKPKKIMKLLTSKV